MKFERKMSPKAHSTLTRGSSTEQQKVISMWRSMPKSQKAFQLITSVFLVLVMWSVYSTYMSFMVALLSRWVIDFCIYNVSNNPALVNTFWKIFLKDRFFNFSLSQERFVWTCLSFFRWIWETAFLTFLYRRSGLFEPDFLFSFVGERPFF